MILMETITEILRESWAVLGLMAPWLLFGFLAAGFLSVFLSPEWVERHLGGRGFKPVLLASLFGVPLPLCSCGVIPVATSLHRHGASRAATTSFLLATPQTGVDSIAVTYALLGPLFALFRPLAALATGLLGGGLVRLFDEKRVEDGEGHPASPACTDSCCAKSKGENRLFRALRYGFVTLPVDIGIALLVGVGIAGTMSALVPPDYLGGLIGGGIVSIFLMIAAGVPVYVCATASVPIAAGFLHMGASPGAALAFLISGPATNAAALSAMWKVLGRKTTFLYLLTVAASAIAFGLLLDLLAPFAGEMLLIAGGHDHRGEGITWFHHLSAVALLGLLAYAYLLEKSGGRSKSATGSAAALEEATHPSLEDQPLERNEKDSEVK